jgi:hypothetical protein
MRFPEDLQLQGHRKQRFSTRLAMDMWLGLWDMA